MLGCLVCFASCQPPNRNRTVNTHDDLQTTEHPTKEATTHDSANLTNQTLINKSGDSNADHKNISDDHENTETTAEASEDHEDHSDHHNNHEVASTEKAVDHTNCPDHSEHQINHNHHIRRHMDAKDDVEVTTAARNASGETSSDELLDDNATVVLIYDVYYPESSEKDYEANYVSSSEECDNCNDETGLSSIECYNCNLW